MRSLVFICALVVCGQALAEPHIGFEARIDEKWNLIRIDKFYSASRARGTGLGPGDVIVAVDRVQVKHPNTIHRYCKRKKVGDVVTVTVNRNHKPWEMKVVLVDGDEARKSGFLDW
jgi:predicted metalloprotease with PDZ domain